MSTSKPIVIQFEDVMNRGNLDNETTDAPLSVLLSVAGPNVRDLDGVRFRVTLEQIGEVPR